MAKAMSARHLRRETVKLSACFKLFKRMVTEGGSLTSGVQVNDHTLILRGRTGAGVRVVVKVLVTQLWTMGTSFEDGAPEPHCVTADRLASAEEIGPPIVFTEWRLGEPKDETAPEASLLCYCLCMEDLGLGDLYDHLWAKPNRHPRITGAFVTDVARQVQRFYDLGWHHGDLKLENVVVDDPFAFRTRLIDFATARPVGTKPPADGPCDPSWCFPRVCSVTGTPTFIPPEKTALKYHEDGCDHWVRDLEKESVFSLGAILLEIITGWPEKWHRGPAPEAFPDGESFETLPPNLPAEHPFLKNSGVAAPGRCARPSGWTYRRDRLLAQRLADLCVGAGSPAPSARPSLDEFIRRAEAALVEHAQLTADDVRLFWDPCACPDGRTRVDPLHDTRRQTPGCKKRVKGHRRGYSTPVASGRSVSEDLSTVLWIPTSVTDD